MNKSDFSMTQRPENKKKRIRYDAKNGKISDCYSFSECEIFLSLIASYLNNVYQEICIIIEHIGKIATLSGFILNNDRIS